MKKKIFASVLALSLIAVLPVAAQVEEDPEAQPSELEEPMAPEEQTAEEQVMAEETAEETVAETSADVSSDEELPKTASPLPLLALLGCLSAGFAATTRGIRRNR